MHRSHTQVALLPVVVVVGVLRHLVPKGDFVLEILLVEIRQRAKVEIELVAVRSLEIELLRRFTGRLVDRHPEAPEEAKGMRQIEGRIGAQRSLPMTPVSFCTCFMITINAPASK